MANTSATGGYLAPAGPVLPEDDELDNLLQELVAGVTGLPGAMVRPRWQPTVPKQPEPNEDWCAIGITRQANDASPAIQHDGTGEGSDEYVRHQEIDLLCSFYGPVAKGYAQRLADSMSISQNSEQLAVNGMKFIRASDIQPAPALINQQWNRRYDLTLTLRRKITRTYPVLNLKSAGAAMLVDMTSGAEVRLVANIVAE